LFIYAKSGGKNGKQKMQWRRFINIIPLSDIANITVISQMNKRKEIELPGCRLAKKKKKKAITGVRIEFAKSGPKSVFRIEIGQKGPDKNWGLSDKGSKGIFGGSFRRPLEGALLWVSLPLP
jgi:hypothetical protein